MAFLVNIPPLGAANYAMQCVVGDTLELSFEVTGMDVRDFAFAWTARRYADDDDTLWAITDAAITWDGDNSQVAMAVPAATTAVLPVGLAAEGAVYDLRWQEPAPGSEVRTLLRGPLHIFRSITAGPTGPTGP